MRITLVAAMSRNGVIGKDGRLPWRLPTDLGRFKRLTLGKPVVMGRKTYESIGRPLPGRTNVVLTRDRTWKPPLGVMEAYTIKDALWLVDHFDEICVIGGSEIYALFLPLASRIELTLVDTEIENGDAFFPFEHHHPEWHGESSPYRGPNDLNEYGMWFMTYTRR